MPTTILRLPAVKARTGLSSSSIYRLIASGEFPKPTRITIRMVGWPESVIEDWLQNKILQSTTRGGKTNDQ